MSDDESFSSAAPKVSQKTGGSPDPEPSPMSSRQSPSSPTSASCVRLRMQTNKPEPRQAPRQTPKPDTCNRLTATRN